MGQDSVVGIATCYGLDGTGIESRCLRDFPHPSRPVLEPIQPLIHWIPAHSRGLQGRGVALTTHPPDNTGVKERVKIYLYSSSRPSWPAVGQFYLFNFTFYVSLFMSVGFRAATCLKNEDWIHNFGWKISTKVYVPTYRLII